jgi:hypothetical protein
LFSHCDDACSVSFALSAIRRPDDDGSRRTFRVFTSVVAAAESSHLAAGGSAASAAAATTAALSDITAALSDSFLSCGPRPSAQLDVINMALELVHALSVHLRVAASLRAEAAACLRDTFVSALTVPSMPTFCTVSSIYGSQLGAGSSDMALSAASGLSLLVTSGVISGTAAADAFTMLCDLAANAKSSTWHDAMKDDAAVPLHLHACRLIVSCVDSSGNSSIRQQFEVICKSRVIPFVASGFCHVLNASSPAPSRLSADDDNLATLTAPAHQLHPGVACVTALCRCSSLVPAVVASFMLELTKHLQVKSFALLSPALVSSHFITEITVVLTARGSQSFKRSAPACTV